MLIQQIMTSDDEIEFLSDEISDKKRSPKPEEVLLSSDENSDNEDLPSGTECLIRCSEFASITGTDKALAMFYLQENNWDLEKSINVYLTATQGTGKKVVACFDVNALDNDEKRKSTEDANGVSFKRSKSDTNDQKTSTELETEKTRHFKIISWNIDGLDGASLEARAIGVTQKILLEKPDIVLLQEVVAETESILRAELGQHYEFKSGNTMTGNQRYSIEKNYYTMILSLKITCSCRGSSVINYGNSVMNRNLLKVQFTYNDKVELCVMTTHLESTKEHAAQRIEQLKRGFQEVMNQEDQTLVIYGGDLNLRDSELTAIGGVPKTMYDMWESTGSRKECLYTWDTMRNTNLQWSGKFKPRMRFDRIFVRPNRVGLHGAGNYSLVPVYFELEGLEKLKNCNRFCSDHWAIQAYCELKLNPDA